MWWYVTLRQMSWDFEKEGRKGCEGDHDEAIAEQGWWRLKNFGPSRVVSTCSVMECGRNAFRLEQGVLLEKDVVESVVEIAV